MATISFYFFAGNFADVMHRYRNGEEQIYQTHNEVARLVLDLLALGHKVRLHSFVTDRQGKEEPLAGLTVIKLGAADYSATSLLAAAVKEDDADLIVAHFPNRELLHAVSRKKRRAIAFLANSYNRTGLRAAIERRRVANILNFDCFELVSNHCVPATQHLASMGVKQSKLIAWDVDHPFSPEDFSSKTLRSADEPIRLFYVGAIIEDKGVSDLLRAIRQLNDQGIKSHCVFAGLGQIDAMTALAREIGIINYISFIGIVGNNEIIHKMRAADVIVVPSRTQYPEGFPLVMFEAVASRTPIVCSDHPMFRPVLIDDVNASLFTSGNSRALADAISRTITDRERYQRLSSAAPSTWLALKGPADWRTLIRKWIEEGVQSPWIKQHMFVNSSARR